jgi:predicted adenylyl cyclase CyaB
MSKEVEILVPVISDEQACYDALEPLDHVSSAHTVDTYYYDPLRNDLKPDDTGRIMACMRIRSKDGVDGGWMAYKSDVFEGDEWLYSNEHETRVEDTKASEDIVRSLGLKVLTIVNCKKHVYMTPDGTKEVVFEQVQGLGNFLEVENKAPVEEDEVRVVKEGLRTFLSKELQLEVGEELNAGKPELMLRKQNSQPLEV